MKSTIGIIAAGVIGFGAGKLIDLGHPMLGVMVFVSYFIVRASLVEQS